MTRKVQVAIIGAGTAGLNAMGQVRRVTDSFVLINGGLLGTTCARVGCMPSKAAIQVADDIHRRTVFAREGISGGEGLAVDIGAAFDHVRDLRDLFVDGVLEHSTDSMGDEFIDGYARFVAPGVLEVNGERIEAGSIVIAAGTRPVVPAAWKPFADRVWTTDELFEQREWPKTMAVIGLGAVGLELGQALSRMGVDVTGMDVLDTIGGISDPVVRDVAVQAIGREFPLWLGQGAEVSEGKDGGLRVEAGERQVVVERILAAMGRRTNLDRLAIENSGLPLDDDGMPRFDPHTMRIGDSRVFLAGDIDRDRQILHEGANEGRIAGFNAVRDEPVRFARTTPLMIAFTEPNICAVGTPFDSLDLDRTVIGEMKLGHLGRAQIMGRNRGVLRVYAERDGGRLLGAAMASPHGEHLAHLIAWSIEQGLTVERLLTMPFYHPTIEEALQSALRDAMSKLPSKPNHPPELRRTG